MEFSVSVFFLRQNEEIKEFIAKVTKKFPKRGASLTIR